MSDRLERFRQFQMSATECVICLGVLTQPKFLSCLHTFCLSCLDQLHHGASSSNAELVCPTCRAITVVPPDGVKALRTNFIVDQMLELRKLCDVTCNACADASSSSSTTTVVMAIAYCVDCGDNLCEDCVSAHRKIRTLRSHRLVDVGSNDAATRLGRPDYCADHSNQELALYCTDCSTSICLSCCVLAHRTHSYVDIREQANESRKGLAKVEDDVSVKLSEFRKASDELELKLTSTNTSSTQTIDEIRRRANEFVAQVRIQESSLVESVQKYQHQFEKQIETILDEIQTKITGLENFIQLCQQLRTSGTHSDVLRLSSQICARADELQAADVNFRVAMPSLVFTPVNENLSEINFLGEVAVIEAEEECGTAAVVTEEERLSNYGTWKMEEGNSTNDSSTKSGNICVELDNYLRRGNNDPVVDLPSDSSTGCDSVARLLPDSILSGNVRASHLHQNSTVENHADSTFSNASTVSTVSMQKSASDGRLSSVAAQRRCERLASYSSSSSSSSSSNATSVDISDASSEDQSEDDDDDDDADNSRHLQNGKIGKNSSDNELPENDHNSDHRRSSETNTPGGGTVSPLPHIPLFSIAGEEPYPYKRCKGPAASCIETISGVEPVVGLALLDRFLFVLRINSNELELYDENSFELIGRESIDDLSQPTDLTACARTHTLYIGHTRKVVFSVKLSPSSSKLSPRKKLSVAFNYTHLSTTFDSTVLMGCPQSEAILEYTEVPHWKLVRCIQMPGTYPTGMVQLSSNRFAVSSRTNVVYVITEDGPNTTCEEVVVPHNMSHMAVDITGTSLLVADCYGHQVRRLETNGRVAAGRASVVSEAKAISKPCRLWTDRTGGRVFVGTRQGDVKVLQLDN